MKVWQTTAECGGAQAPSTWLLFMDMDDMESRKKCANETGTTFVYEFHIVYIYDHLCLYLYVYRSFF